MEIQPDRTVAEIVFYRILIGRVPVSFAAKLGEAAGSNHHRRIGRQSYITLVAIPLVQPAQATGALWGDVRLNT